MVKHKSKLITAAVIIAVLFAAWFMSGSFSDSHQKSEPPNGAIEVSSLSEKNDEAVPENDAGNEGESDTEQAEPSITPETVQSSDEELSPPETTDTSKKADTIKQEISDSTGKDKYQTAPVPEGKPLPVEPADVSVSEAVYTCTLTVRCDTVLNNSDKLDKEKSELIPEDGVIFKTIAVNFYEGESVFNVLQREMKRNKIHMAFRNTPIYNSAYILAINNLYEFDCGELSGWIYKVYGWFPNYGCSRYQLKDGDVIEWVYTCDLGRDVGGADSMGGQFE